MGKKRARTVDPRQKGVHFRSDGLEGIPDGSCQKGVDEADVMQQGVFNDLLNVVRGGGCDTVGKLADIG